MDSLPERFADRELLQKLLHEYNEDIEQRERIAKEIQERFQRKLAVLVLDSSGFTRSVREGGLIPFLALIERMQRLIGPAIERTGGQLLKTEADNVFAVYETPDEAVAGAKDIRATLRAVNEALPEREEIYVSMGIGYGDVLMVGADDLYGDEMNLACKLGEDVADRDEILISGGAYENLTDTKGFEPTSISISGVEISAYRVVDPE